MQGRSWMAALAIAASTFLAAGPTARAEDKPPVTKVKLEIRIAGLSHDGSDIEIKPAHAGCQFKTATYHVTQQGRASLLLEDVQSSSADRDCALAITLKEAGQPARTIRRGLRLVAPPSGSIPSLTCYMSSPSKLAKSDEERARR